MEDIFLRFCLGFFFFAPGLVSSEAKCCSTILLDVEDPESDVHILQGSRLGFYKQVGQYGDKAQYKQVDGNNYIFYSEVESMWITTPQHVGSTTTGITSKSAANCADSLPDWQYYNGTQWQYNRNLKSSCAQIEDTCCKHIEMSSTAGNTTKDNSSSLKYAEEARKTLGKYTAVGTSNGRYIYQHDGMDRYLEFDESNQNWLIVREIGCTSGFIYHSGGSVCPENSGNRWHTASRDEEKNTTGWAHDPDFNVRCLEVNESSKKTSEESSPGEVTTNSTTATTIMTSTVTTSSPATPATTINATETTQNMSSSTPSNIETTTPVPEELTSAPADNQDSPQANPLISKSEESGSSVTPVVVSLLFLVVFAILAVIFVRRLRTSWRSGSHGRQLVMETIGLYRD